VDYSLSIDTKILYFPVQLGYRTASILKMAVFWVVAPCSRDYRPDDRDSKYI
jgi:hypothetical protein